MTVSRAQVDSSSRSVVLLKLTADQVLVFRLDRGRISKLGRIVRKLINANPGLKVNQIITFSSFQVFLLLCFAHMVIIETQKAKQYTENLSAKLQNSNQNFTISWVSLIGL